MYGRPCKASDYGFSRISEVIDAVCNVAEVRGKGAEKIVVLVDGDDVTLHGREGICCLSLCFSIFIIDYLALINRAVGLYGRILTEVVSTDLSSVNKMFTIWQTRTV